MNAVAEPRAEADRDGLPVLWHLRFSHFNEKARWALDYKGIPHRRASTLPGMHIVRAKRLYGGETFPALVLDGEAIGSSDAIIDAIEQRWPQPPLYPESEIDRELALELQRYFDVELGPHIRRWFFFHQISRPGEASATMAQGFPLPARAAYRAAFPLLRLAMKRTMRLDATGAELGQRKTLAALDRIESELGPSGYLVGDRFSVADLTAAALLFPLVRPPELQCEVPPSWAEPIEQLRDSLVDRPGFRWVEEMWRRHRGVSAEVPA
ncbi:MAG: glutathione S-transferase [Solirubrobacterales bacterium]|nr:glutathione S-transferase [Solirubrobacterales bacterium]